MSEMTQAEAIEAVLSEMGAATKEILEDFANGCTLDHSEAGCPSRPIPLDEPYIMQIRFEPAVVRALLLPEA